MVRAARAPLEASDRAAVVMTSSIAYAASKGALNAMTMGLARAVAPKIRVNAICPGYIDSPWFDRLGYVGGKERLAEHIGKVTPLKDVSQPEDIADSALFLGSRAARHITGETLLVDAGMHLAGT
jgi:NAD(P)-dependent dehydrogenase (short-subunit alcohol dehydrogenase family)